MNDVVFIVAENLLKDSFVVMGDQENRYNWLDHNHGTSVKFVDADEYEVKASHMLFLVQQTLLSASPLPLLLTLVLYVRVYMVRRTFHTGIVAC